MEAKAKNNIVPGDFSACAAWRYEEDSDLYYPVRGEDDISESLRDLSIRAVFTTPSGEKLDGYVVGTERIFSIGLFWGERTYHINKNLSGLSKEQVDEYLSQRGGASDLQYESMFPLHFQSRWGDDTFVDFSGVFEM
ncbi:hypothetical protein [Nitrogeniibacter aestuarii]|uniref:hypothetical protein n=1 Tax=Nitrogeniibacter aestuarii TaxID=2815343 RepID=UPI001D125B8F|nr:hypothetical protein [Nitrogeniibacter aestuarii]